MKKITYGIIALVILLIIGFLSITQCQEKPEGITGQATSDLQQNTGMMRMSSQAM